MHWIDWVIVILGQALVMYIGLKTQRYVKGVSDFLTAGRVAGRYVLCVSGFEAGMGLISLVAVYESYYKSGFAYGFWSSIASPLFIVLGLMGYCVYRFRETRAMTMGQFLEMRYSRRFRLFAGILQSISGIVNYALFPAVGARFVVYFCDLPITLNLGGWEFPTFGLLMAIFLALAVVIAGLGGQITIMTTDCIQGLFSYPMYVIIVIFFLLKFSWFKDMAPAMMDRPAGQSLINPFDIGELRDFNLFYVLVGIVSGLVNRMSWCGTQGYSCAARNAHEQKMAGVLSTWRSGFSSMMFILLAVVGFAYLNSEKYQDGPNGAVACRTALAVKAVDDVVTGPSLAPARKEVIDYLKTGTVTPELQAMLDKTARVKATEEAERARIRYVGGDESASASAVGKAAGATGKAPETPKKNYEARMQTAQDAIRAVDPGASQTFATIFGQMRVPIALRYLMPIGITGLFCAICIFLMISTDTAYLHSWGSIVVQDVILPMRRKPFTPKQQLALLRLLIALVAVFAFFFSYFFGQVDYILMFFAITGAIWLGGSGPCIVGGLYWKRGTTPAAWAALTSGSSLAVAAIFAQKYWVPAIYPWLHAHGLVDTVAVWLERCSAPFEPIIKWRMSSEKFPINSQEVYAITMLVSIGLYVIISLITSSGGRVFNMDRMLHRGKYRREGDGEALNPPRITLRRIIPYFIGIDSQYTRGDKVLSWSVFIWSFGWGFLCCFVGVAVWNFISPWSNHGWSIWFYINNFLLAGLIGVVSTIWFTIGCTIDLRRLFRDLAKTEENVLDDGRVIGHISAADVDLVEKVDHVTIEEAHAKEEVLRKELEAEHDQVDLENLEQHTKK
jgi:solute:Na+ symporter, SSS family